MNTKKRYVLILTLALLVGAALAALTWAAPRSVTQAGGAPEVVAHQGEVRVDGTPYGGDGYFKFAVVNSAGPDQATLVLAGDTSLHDLAVGNYGVGDQNTAPLALPGTERTLVADVKAMARGSGTNNLAIFLTGSGTEVTLQEVTALGEDGSVQNHGLVNNNGALAVLHGGSFTGRGGAGTNWGIVNSDPGTRMEAENVTALGENGSGGFNHGLDNFDAAAVILHGGSFTGRGGVSAYGIHNNGDTSLEAEGIIALGENGSSNNYGLDSADGVEATLYGGAFTARGGTHAYGISNSGTNAHLKAESVTALGDGASTQNTGLYNTDATAGATLYGGSFFGHEGDMALGIFNYAATLEAVGVTATGGNGTDNYGLDNEGGGDVAVQGGSFTGRGGVYARGIYNSGSDTTLETESVTTLGENASINYGLFNGDGAAATLHGGSFTALGEDGSSANYGLRNQDSATATLRGGTFTGHGGSYAYGVNNYGSDTTLKAESVTALGEDGSDQNYGLYNYGAEATLRGGAFTGRTGTSAYGISNNTATLEAQSVIALGQDGSSHNFGLDNLNSNSTANVTQSVLEGATNSVYRSTGAVTVSNSRLVGGAVFGTVTCVLVTRGTTISTDGSTCP